MTKSEQVNHQSVTFKVEQMPGIIIHGRIGNESVLLAIARRKVTTQFNNTGLNQVTFSRRNGTSHKL